MNIFLTNSIDYKVLLVYSESLCDEFMPISKQNECPRHFPI